MGDAQKSGSKGEPADVVVIGAGLLGLAIGRALAQAGREVVLLEAEKAMGTITSSRNSEVIHAGIYYPPGSLKALFCVAGKQMLYDYCQSRGVAHARIGKLLVATEEAEIVKLERLHQRAGENGVDDLRWLSEAEAKAMEPALRCVGAILSPSTGIIDSHGLMLAYRGDLEDSGGMIAFGARVAGGEATPDGILLHVEQEEPMDLLCRTVVNCAGLGAQPVAASIKGVPSASVPPLHFAKGNYFGLNGRAPFSHLIYPMPGGGGLGAHLTLDLAGRARFGPDVEWVNRIDYAVDPKRADSFYASIHRYWPGLPDGALVPDYSGVRPKLYDNPNGDADFVIQGEEAHGVPGLVNLYGIESPGLTSSLAIADYVRRVIVDFNGRQPSRDRLAFLSDRNEEKSEYSLGA
jgi:L-2-hydroxyglutarate oxidase LhgO